MKTPPRAAFADFVRSTIEGFDGWDVGHEFYSLHWDGEKINVGLLALITFDVQPDRLPAQIARLSYEALTSPKLEHPPYAYALRSEGFGVQGPRPTDPAEVHAAYHSDRINRRFRDRPDAKEFASVWCVDIHHRAWQGSLVRNDPAGPHYTYHHPADKAGLGGQLIRALYSAATATGVVAYGHPLPAGARLDVPGFSAN